jgi:hypothetical protein
MNLTVWTGIREYVAAEIRLSLARYQLFLLHDQAIRHNQSADELRAEIATLEEQSTRMETSVREAL